VNYFIVLSFSWAYADAAMDEGLPHRPRQMMLALAQIS